jgi:hypothetical protein
MPPPCHELVTLSIKSVVYQGARKKGRKKRREKGRYGEGTVKDSTPCKGKKEAAATSIPMNTHMPMNVLSPTCV